jgi:aminoglycoside 2''-phosphotransferase
MSRKHFISNLDTQQILAGLRFSFPHLPAFDDLELMGDGFSSYVVLAAGEYLFRIAKHRQAMRGHLLESKVLPRIAADLPTSIPKPIWQQDPNDYFPFGVSGYRYIPGVPLNPDVVTDLDCGAIARDLAEFLLGLHEIPEQQVQDCGLGNRVDSRSLPDAVTAVLASALAGTERGKLVDWWHAGFESIVDQPTPRLLHGDLWYENIILAEDLTEVAGVVDFESMAFGDIARDFAPLRYLGDEFADLVVSAYREMGGVTGPNLALRLQREALLREFAGLVYAVQFPESGELTDSVAKLRKLLVSMELADH